jgi:hypothetical protein
MDNKSIKPSIEVALEKGIKSLFMKKFKYEKTTEDNETKFQFQLVTASIF